MSRAQQPILIDDDDDNVIESDEDELLNFGHLPVTVHDSPPDGYEDASHTAIKPYAVYTHEPGQPVDIQQLLRLSKRIKDIVDFDILLKNDNIKSFVGAMARISPYCEAGAQTAIRKLLSRWDVRLAAALKRASTAGEVAILETSLVSEIGDSVNDIVPAVNEDEIPYCAWLLFPDWHSRLLAAAKYVQTFRNTGTKLTDQSNEALETTGRLEAIRMLWVGGNVNVYVSTQFLEAMKDQADWEKKQGSSKSAAKPRQLDHL